MTFKTIAVETAWRPIITFSPKFSAVCSIGKSPFHGQLTITYRPKGLLVEFESFEQWVRSWSMDQMTIEQVCELVFDELVEGLSIDPNDVPDLHVEVYAETTVHAPVIVTMSIGEFDNA